MGLRRTRHVTMSSADNGYRLLRYQSAWHIKINGVLRGNKPTIPVFKTT